jgi:hypothetical protein
MTAKPPTPQAISALLSKAGFEKVTHSKSRIRGMREHSAGYHVQADLSGAVSVNWWQSSFSHGSDPARTDAMLARYADAILAAGFAVENHAHKLIVTASPAASGEATGSKAKEADR